MVPGTMVNVFVEEELDKVSTVANFATVQNAAGRFVERKIEFFNLDVIISVGYRVKSIKDTQFRIWANKVLKDYLLKGYSINNRMNRLEDNFDELKQEVQEIYLQINSKLLPTLCNIFMNGILLSYFENICFDEVSISTDYSPGLIFSFDYTFNFYFNTKLGSFVKLFLISDSARTLINFGIKLEYELYQFK